ncbi:hypothetical protein AVEN_119097-1 [Araneus ventricosus]|uniref:Uncharacterized protein n=1 Tax=Araneus ventricosus TaxID=182803 RepID=A0A4Y2BKB1_ARAVE|nr:hypothetical protein AVEN_119097-1 [Araneus ventricosus]
MGCTVNDSNKKGNENDALFLRTFQKTRITGNKENKTSTNWQHKQTANQLIITETAISNSSQRLTADQLALRTKLKIIHSLSTSRAFITFHGHDVTELSRGISSSWFQRDRVISLPFSSTLRPEAETYH